MSTRGWKVPDGVDLTGSTLEKNLNESRYRRQEEALIVSEGHKHFLFKAQRQRAELERIEEARESFVAKITPVLEYPKDVAKEIFSVALRQNLQSNEFFDVDEIENQTEEVLKEMLKAIAVPSKAPINSKCIQVLNEFEKTFGGRSGGWESDEHKDFLKIYTRWKSYPPTLLARLRVRFPYRSKIGLLRHIEWKEKLEELEDKAEAEWRRQIRASRAGKMFRKTSDIEKDHEILKNWKDDRGMITRIEYPSTLLVNPIIKENQKIHKAREIAFRRRNRREKKNFALNGKWSATDINAKILKHFVEENGTVASLIENSRNAKLHQLPSILNFPPSLRLNFSDNCSINNPVRKKGIVPAYEMLSEYMKEKDMPKLTHEFWEGKMEEAFDYDFPPLLVETFYPDDEEKPKKKKPPVSKMKVKKNKEEYEQLREFVFWKTPMPLMTGSFCSMPNITRRIVNHKLVKGTEFFQSDENLPYISGYRWKIDPSKGTVQKEQWPINFLEKFFKQRRIDDQKERAEIALNNETDIEIMNAIS